ncbi:hypothetical protein INT43_008787 [Umbelopsis isabellina]|uniref:Uncharacterized protein n=1 Tax=Mortierella isabellina TaxID=91625 RepID=A0A8H7UFK9_MORIS|nr:hypothetical protein INT43_008787 [Umbelopsis isabellina]
MQKRFTRISGVPPIQRRLATLSRPASSSDSHSSREDQKGESSVKELGSDMKTVMSDFTNVPRPAILFGFAGALPCLAASVMSIAYADTPELLAFIEPVQVGYGACILSWLGAIHWGLEMAKYNGTTGYARYSYGVIPPLLAWPTLFFPTDVALLSQSVGFVFLLYTDVKAAGRGWTPKWYPFLRYWLTWIAGGSIWLSLIGKDWKRRGRPNAYDTICIYAI